MSYPSTLPSFLGADRTPAQGNPHKLFLLDRTVCVLICFLHSKSISQSIQESQCFYCCHLFPQKDMMDKKIEGEAKQSGSLDKRKKVGLVEKLLGMDQS